MSKVVLLITYQRYFSISQNVNLSKSFQIPTSYILLKLFEVVSFIYEILFIWTNFWVHYTQKFPSTNGLDRGYCFSNLGFEQYLRPHYPRKFNL